MQTQHDYVMNMLICILCQQAIFSNFSTGFSYFGLKIVVYSSFTTVFNHKLNFTHWPLTVQPLTRFWASLVCWRNRFGPLAAICLPLRYNKIPLVLLNSFSKRLVILFFQWRQPWEKSSCIKSICAVKIPVLYPSSYLQPLFLCKHQITPAQLSETLSIHGSAKRNRT